MRRTVVVTVLAVLAGFLLGVLLSEIIGIIGYLATGDEIGIKFLPLYLGAVFGVAVPVGYLAFGRARRGDRSRRRS